MDSSIVASLILSGTGIIISIIISIIFGYIPKVKKHKMELLHKELLISYKDIKEFHKLENTLLELANISKIKARTNLNISSQSEFKRIEKRINELENIL